MGDSLQANGWDVTGIGLPGARSAPPSWPIIEAPPAPVREPASSRHALAALERMAARGLSTGLWPAQLLLRRAGSAYAAPLSQIRTRLVETDRPVASFARTLQRAATRRARARTQTPDERALDQYWRLSVHLDEMRRLAVQQSGPALWIANDWWMLPIAGAGQEAHGGVIAYDSHELATEEYAELPEWVKFQKPVVESIERNFIDKARVITSVSPGIVEDLQRRYAPDANCLTLRNAPHYAASVFRPAGEAIRVLYHGLVTHGRGLEAMIDSLPDWRSEFSLTVRGPSSPPEYIDTLKARAERNGVLSRITFAPPVPTADLVATARAYDIGVMVLPSHSRHAELALPNKIFEYLMAGLALVVTDLPEMAALVRSSGTGRTIPDHSPTAITACINALSRKDIDDMKQAALTAAKLYNWETESAPVLAAYDACFAPQQA